MKVCHSIVLAKLLPSKFVQEHGHYQYSSLAGWCIGRAPQPQWACSAACQQCAWMTTMTIRSWSPSQRDKCTVHSLQTIMALWKLWGLSCVAPTCLNGWLWKRAHLSHNTVETLLSKFVTSVIVGPSEIGLACMTTLAVLRRHIRFAL